MNIYGCVKHLYYDLSLFFKMYSNFCMTTIFLFKQNLLDELSINFPSGLYHILYKKRPTLESQLVLLFYHSNGHILPLDMLECLMNYL